MCSLLLLVRVCGSLFDLFWFGQKHCLVRGKVYGVLMLLWVLFVYIFVSCFIVCTVMVYVLGEKCDYGWGSSVFLTVVSRRFYCLG